MVGDIIALYAMMAAITAGCLIDTNLPFDHDRPVDAIWWRNLAIMCAMWPAYVAIECFSIFLVIGRHFKGPEWMLEK